MKMIAFTAKKQSGKTTAVQHLRKNLQGSVQINFKDALIDELKLYFPELLAEIGRIYDNTPATYDGTPWTTERLFKEKPPLIRSLMRNWGTEFRRAQDPDYWVKEWQKRVDACTSADIFVDDVRFLNEAEAIKRNGGTLIRIKTDQPAQQDSHTSESEMDQIIPDYEVKNPWGHPDYMLEVLDEIVA